MSIATEISRIQADRNTIRAKLVELGIATSVDGLDALAAAIESLVNRGAVSVEIKEGTTYTIPAGYHNGSGVVKAISDTAGDAETYKTQAKTVTPTKKQQSVTPDSGYYALASVTVGAIPDAYQDVTSVTAEEGDVLTGKVFVTSDGTVVAGTMANNGAVSKTLDATVISYTIPKGYHSGTGKVTISVETKTVTPTKSAQTVTPTSGKVLSSVTVEPIPDDYIQTIEDSDVAAEAFHILADKVAYVNGERIEGTMPNNAPERPTLDTTKTSYEIPEGYYAGGGRVDIVLETKNATPTKSVQNITPTAGKVLSKVTVNAIPDEYITTTDADAAGADILYGKTAYVKGSKVTGAMPNNGDVTATIDGLSATSATIPAGYTSGGTISLTSDIEEALAAI